jgi:hypothetical protein
MNITAIKVTSLFFLLGSAIYFVSVQNGSRSRWCAAFWRGVVLFLFCFFSGINPTQAQRYVEISAQIQTFSYQENDLPEGRNPIQRDYSVICVIGTNQWRIDTGFSEKGGYQWLFDGTNLYDNIIVYPKLSRPLTNDNNELQTLTQSPAIKRSINTVHVFSSSNGCPLGDSQVNLPWLLFCSGRFLRAEGRVIPFPVVDLRHTPDAFAYSDRTQTFDDELGLPRSIDLFASQSLFKASVNSEIFEGKHDVEMWKRGSMGYKWNLAEGALRFRYSVVESTNFFGWNIPVAAEWALNIPETGKLVPLGRMRVASLAQSEGPKSVILGSPMPNNVIDWRFHNVTRTVPAIKYQTTNGFVEPTNNSELQRVFNTTLKKAPLLENLTLSPKGAKLVRMGFMIFLFLSSLIPLGIFITKYRNKTPNKTTIHEE